MPARVYMMFVVAATSATVLLAAHLWAAKSTTGPSKMRVAQAAGNRP